MRLSIWQQFSSNHSSSYYIVGEFPTIQKAEEATTEIRRLVNEIALWREKDREKDSGWLDHSLLTPPEELVKQKYKVDDWTWAIQWYESPISNIDDPNHNPTWIDEAIVLSGRAIFITSRYEEGFDLGGPFPKILQHYDAKTVIYAEDYSLQHSFEIRCRALNVDIAKDIEHRFQEYFANKDEIIHPWNTDWQEVLYASHSLKKEHSQILVKEYYRQIQQVKYYAEQSETTEEILQKQIQSKQKFYLGLYGKVERIDKQLIFSDIFRLDLGTSILIATLEAYGCTDIKYEMKLISDNEQNK